MNANYCATTSESLLLLNGPDSLKFLQGQATCDTDKLDEYHALPGAYCNPQGRVVCDFLLCQLGAQSFGLRMKRDIKTSSAAVFGKYIVFSKAELNENDEEWETLACWGEQVREQLLSAIPELPQEQYGSICGDGFCVVQLDTAGNQYECFINRNERAELIETITAELTQAEESIWQSLQISAGMGRIESANIETFIPQMLNYDITGHVSFTKGCYTGQEVVARMHYRGKPKRRMYLASVSSDFEPEAGTALFSGEGSQSVGNVVNSAASSPGDVSMLVVATAAGVEQGLHLGDLGGPVLQVGSQPYPLEKP
ncbi:MAG: folate-binding protein YgfZ [Halioglobus sp.]